MGKPKVLIVEDSPEYQEIFAFSLHQQTELLQAFSIHEAEKLFASHQNIAIIAVDACVPGSKPNTQNLVRYFRKSFVGPIIAISNLTRYNEELQQAGCSHAAQKHLLPQLILSLLAEYASGGQDG